jgi:hypothetical protein
VVDTAEKVGGRAGCKTHREQEEIRGLASV